VSSLGSEAGFGQAEIYVGYFDVATSSYGIANFASVLPTTAVQPGMFVTMTATDIFGNTSELSPSLLVQGPTDGDLDSMSDEVESRSPNLAAASGTGPQGDGNGDGVPDSQQANVCSFPSLAGKWWTIAAPGGIMVSNVLPSVAPASAVLPASYEFPLGIVSFSLTGVVPGGTVTVTNIFHDSVDLTTVFAYGPTPDNPQPHWYEFLFDGVTGATLGTDQVVLTFLDAGRGDRDVHANGVVTTLLAPARLAPPGPLLQLLSVSVSLVKTLNTLQVSTNAPVLTTNQVPAVSSVLAWPGSATNYVLEYADGLSPTNVWRRVSDPPARIANQLVVTNTSPDAMRFYRMVRFAPVIIQPAAPNLFIQRTSTNTFPLSWLASFAGFALEQNTSLVAGTWTRTTNLVSVTNGQNQVLVAPATGSRFFRLTSP